MVTPLIHHLKDEGYRTVLLGSAAANQIFKHNPYLDEFVLHKQDSIPNELLYQYFETTAEAHDCEELLDLCESIECNLTLHPCQAQYNWTKKEREALCNKNFYDETFVIGDYPDIKGRRGEMFFTEYEEEECARFRNNYIGKPIIMWCLSGSGRNKSYPYTAMVMDEILKKYPEIVFITVGDEICEVLESELKGDRIIWKSNKWSFRESALMSKYAALIVSPDTGMLHAAGCHTTPTIGLLGHTSKTNITKNFVDDYSIQAETSCAPCYRLIYSGNVQCPIDNVTGACWCMAYGLQPERIIERIEEIINVNLPYLQGSNRDKIQNIRL